MHSAHDGTSGLGRWRAASAAGMMHRMRLALFFFSGAVIASLLLAQPAAACGCPKPRSIKDLRYPSLVFRGEVVSVSRPAWTRKPPGQDGARDGQDEAVVTFRVIEQYQGPHIKEVAITYSRGGTSCDLEPLDFARGEVYLVSTLVEQGVPLARQQFTGNYCTLRQRLSPAALRRP